VIAAQHHGLLPSLDLQISPRDKLDLLPMSEHAKPISI